MIKDALDLFSINLTLIINNREYNWIYKAYFYENIRLNLKSFSLLNLKLKNRKIVSIRQVTRDKSWMQTIIRILKTSHSFFICLYTLLKHEMWYQINIETIKDTIINDKNLFCRSFIICTISYFKINKLSFSLFNVTRIFFSWMKKNSIT